MHVIRSSAGNRLLLDGHPLPLQRAISLCPEGAHDSCRREPPQDIRSVDSILAQSRSVAQMGKCSHSNTLQHLANIGLRAGNHLRSFRHRHPLGLGASRTSARPISWCGEQPSNIVFLASLYSTLPPSNLEEEGREASILLHL